MFSRARSRQLFASPRSPSRWKFSPRTIAGFEAAATTGRAGAGVVDETAWSTSSGSPAAGKAVTPSPRPDESDVLPKRSRVKGSLSAIGEVSCLGRTASPRRRCSAGRAAWVVDGEALRRFRAGRFG